ncbi:hypothetical protein [Halalkalibacter urbisdiaboli]|uniref:exo-rhamnogalacturonan lyase family protein n=1 Tax=Halalkalibacter urbisdiaboli TaxID=1960589 RepID=UPI000B44D82C|nr:hypothetical protein [Halalkalibacter urbisdiaboli]
MYLKWLNQKPKHSSGVTWGVPWKKGERKREDTFVVKNQKGESLHVQTWPLAFWPDGSVKWSGHSAVFQGNTSNTYQLELGEAFELEQRLTVQETDEEVMIRTGKVDYVLNKSGEHLIEEICIEEKTVGSKGKLIAISERRAEENEVTISKKQEPLVSEIKKIYVEQSGPIRAVIKVEGVLKGGNERKWLPFSVRFYFHAGLDSFKIIHTFFYDGNPEVDFIKGLGMEFTVPLIGEPWNRHIRFAGDDGVYREPGQLLLTRRYPDGNGLYEKQVNGEAVDITTEEQREFMRHVKDNAAWNDFKLIQDSADHFKIQKRTKVGHAWVDVTHGSRSNGVVFAGGKQGGLAIGLRNFWQKHPTSLEISSLLKEETKIKVWFWSPDVEAMDMRHYDKETHVLSAYEGFDEMRATPVGIANTSELFINVCTKTPNQEYFQKIIEDGQEPPLLICEPEYYYQTRAIGLWSLPDRSKPEKAFLETQLDKALSFYQDEIEQRKWYGYWHYGDVMHTYDKTRHQWRYDLGGFAWQNTELGPNIWLWFAFLRSGRHDIFRMAEAMTRHTSEVDCYHFGEYAGLGSRHNVIHWGCGCKEARISMAGIHKFYYFLTADDRTRDILEEMKDADFATEKLDPMREFYPKDQYPTHARVGPDWAAFTSNWLSEWERTENTFYKDKILQGINDLKQLPHRLLSGPTFGYDPKTGKLYHIGDGNEGGYHMVIAFGAPQVWIELADLLEDEEWKDMLADFGEFYMLSDEEKKTRSDGKLHNRMYSLPMLAAGMISYAAWHKRDAELAKKAWNTLLDESISFMTLPIQMEKVKSWRTLSEMQSNSVVSTNTISQWCLNTIIALELIGEHLSENQVQELIDSVK